MRVDGDELARCEDCEEHRADQIESTKKHDHEPHVDEEPSPQESTRLGFVRRTGRPMQHVGERRRGFREHAGSSDYIRSGSASYRIRSCGRNCPHLLVTKAGEVKTVTVKNCALILRN